MKFIDTYGTKMSGLPDPLFALGSTRATQLELVAHFGSPMIADREEGGVFWDPFHYNVDNFWTGEKPTINQVMQFLKEATRDVMGKEKYQFLVQLMQLQTIPVKGIAVEDINTDSPFPVEYNAPDWITGGSSISYYPSWDLFSAGAYTDIKLAPSCGALALQVSGERVWILWDSQATSSLPILEKEAQFWAAYLNRLGRPDYETLFETLGSRFIRPVVAITKGEQGLYLPPGCRYCTYTIEAGATAFIHQINDGNINMQVLSACNKIQAGIALGNELSKSGFLDIKTTTIEVLHLVEYLIQEQPDYGKQFFEILKFSIEGLPTLFEDVEVCVLGTTCEGLLGSKDQEQDAGSTIESHCPRKPKAQVQEESSTATQQAPRQTQNRTFFQTQAEHNYEKEDSLAASQVSRKLQVQEYPNTGLRVTHEREDSTEKIQAPRTQQAQPQDSFSQDENQIAAAQVLRKQHVYGYGHIYKQKQNHIQKQVQEDIHIPSPQVQRKPQDIMPGPARGFAQDNDPRIISQVSRKRLQTVCHAQDYSPDEVSIQNQVQVKAQSQVQERKWNGVPQVTRMQQCQVQEDHWSVDSQVSRNNLQNLADGNLPNLILRLR